MRFACRAGVTLPLLAAALAGAVRADDGADRARRVRVALALADQAGRRPAADSPAVRAESRATGKPVVLFVAGAEAGKAAAVPPAAIPARADRYTGDGSPDPAAPRVVLLKPEPAGGFKIDKQLPASVPADVLRVAVAAAAPKPVDWTVGP